MRAAGAVLAVVLLSAIPGAAEMWRYEDAQGNVAFVDDPSKIPAQYRASARAHVPASEGTPNGLASGDMQAILKKRHEILSHYTTEQAEAALRKGLLTVDEVEFLVSSGALRASAVGVQYRDAVHAAPQPATAASPKTVDAAERDLIMLQALGSGTGRNVPLTMLQEFGSRVQNNPHVRYALMGEGILFLVLLAALPFLLRKYHDESTRRIVRTSLFLIFVIVSATGNLILFRDDIAFLLAAGKAPPAPAPAAAQTYPPRK